MARKSTKKSAKKVPAKAKTRPIKHNCQLAKLEFCAKCATFGHCTAKNAKEVKLVDPI